MEEKRTPLTMAGGILDNIFSIAEKFITGLSSFGKKDISEQLSSFAETLKQIPLEKRSLSKEESDALLRIFIAAANPLFAKQFMGEVDPEVYFSFGTFLNEQFKDPRDNIQEITHEYLNLFRFSSLLTKIYGDTRWEDVKGKGHQTDAHLGNRPFPGYNFVRMIAFVDEEVLSNLIEKNTVLNKIVERDDDKIRLFQVPLERVV